MKKMRSYITAILVLAIIFSLFPITASAAEFSDVPPNHWAYSTISTMADAGIVQGFPNGQFHPKNTISRAEWAKLMVLTANLPVSDSAPSTFDDVPYKQWSRPYIEAAKYYLTGYRIGGKSVYLPEQGVSRADCAVAIVRLLGLESMRPDYSILKNMFRDYDAIMALDDAMVANIAIAVENGLMLGDTNGNFKPNNVLSRAEAAMLLNRIGSIAPVLEPILEVAVSSILLDIGAAELIEGETLLLNVKIIPEEARTPQLLWNSSDKTVAYVDTTGKVTAISAGTTVISVTTTDNVLRSECTLTVTKEIPDVLLLDKKTLELDEGDEATLQVRILPESAGLPTLQWNSSNTNVAYVSRAGKITALSAGTATITVQTTDGRLNAQCIITVKSSGVSLTPNDSVNLSANSITLSASKTTVLFGEKISLYWELPLGVSVYGITVYAAKSGGNFQEVFGSSDNSIVGYGSIADRSGTYNFKVKVSSSIGTLESNVVTITVTIPEAPDLGKVQDITEFWGVED